MSDEPHPDHTLPGDLPPNPDDPHVEHPIVLPEPPPTEPPVDENPPEIWPPGSGIDMPEHPIVIPPELPTDPDAPVSPPTLELDGYWAVSPGNAPAMYVADCESTEVAADKYAKFNELVAGDKVLVITAVDNFVVGAEPVEAEPKAE